MRAYTIKHKGATIWSNIDLDRKFTFSDGDKIVVGNLFFRKKDAQKYLNTFEDKQYFEVVGMTIDKTNQDNRRRR